jgi:Protein of unknown function (DUF4065)
MFNDDRWWVNYEMKMYRQFSRFSVIMTIQYQLQPEKAVEAAAMFLKLHGRPMRYLGLLKLLYMADRIALERMEQPITGDCYVSMQFGPVLSGVYDLIKGNNVGQALPVWSQFIPQLVLKLKQERQVDLSSSRLRELLKKSG